MRHLHVKRCVRDLKKKKNVTETLMVSEPNGQLTHPEVVHNLDSLLKIYWYVHSDIMIETRANGEPLRQWRPVVLTACADKANSVWIINHVSYAC